MFYFYFVTHFYKIHKIYHTKETTTKENILLIGRGFRLCQRTEDAADSDLAMIVAGL